MATNTYVALKSTTLTSATGTVTFDLAGISGYTDLKIVVSARGTTTAYCAPSIQFNSDTSPSGTNYSWTAMFGDGSSPISYRVSNQNVISGEQIPRSNDTAGLFGLVTFDIMNYSNSTTHKTVLVRNSSLGSTCVTLAAVGLWRAASPTPITYITIISGTPNFEVGSTFTVYGISDAGQVGTKAIGGDVYSDSTYVYHAFPMSGKFTPTQALTADILVVAGGGPGAGAGGGGGAGGLLAFTSQSLTSGTNYQCLVGAGGTGSNGSGGGATNGNDSKFGSLTTALGGGYAGGYGGGASYFAANSGGSGGGAPYYTGLGAGSGTAGQGNAGNVGYQGTGGGDPRSGGGGGGAGGAATNGGVPNVGGNGGVGSSIYSSWGLATGFGENISGTVYFAGGGGGQGQDTGGTAGYGGGGVGRIRDALNGVSGLPNTGGGGGGGGQGGYYVGTKGGSGIIIVRYVK